MIIPIYIAYTAQQQLDATLLSHRLDAILSYLQMDDNKDFVVHQMHHGRGGLVFIERRQSQLRVPLVRRTTRRMTVSAYTPFGTTQYVDETELRSGDYLPHLFDRLRTTPHMLEKFAPPLVWCDLDQEQERLTLVNDYRGFGRLYHYTTSFGTVWSNKMAAALLLAGVPARLDEEAWAEMAATGMFFGTSTGYEDMTFAAPGSLITTDLRSGQIECRRLSTDCGGVSLEPNPPHAAEEAHEALQLWCNELIRFQPETLHLSLSGGRDSRVVAAHLLSTGAHVDITTSFPPRKDAELAQQLVALLSPAYSLKSQPRKDESVARYRSIPDVIQYTQKWQVLTNLDISVSSNLSAAPRLTLDPSSKRCIGGAQGEIAHNIHYTQTMVTAQRQWESFPDTKESPAQKHLAGYLRHFTTQTWGLNERSKQQAYTNIQKFFLPVVAAHNIKSFYKMDLLYLIVFLNRQWAGANGNEDMKSPLTVFPYVRYGFAQTLESKLNSAFIRDVIALAQPRWRDIPFFHELPQEEQEDFHIAYPTYWEMGRGEELQELCSSAPELWRHFDQDSILPTFARLHETQGKAPEMNDRSRTECNHVAQRMLWYCAARKNLQDINTIISRN